MPEPGGKFSRTIGTPALLFFGLLANGALLFLLVRFAFVPSLDQSLHEALRVVHIAQFRGLAGSGRPAWIFGSFHAAPEGGTLKAPGSGEDCLYYQEIRETRDLSAGNGPGTESRVSGRVPLLFEMEGQTAFVLQTNSFPSVACARYTERYETVNGKKTAVRLSVLKPGSRGWVYAIPGVRNVTEPAGGIIVTTLTPEAYSKFGNVRRNAGLTLFLLFLLLVTFTVLGMALYRHFLPIDQKARLPVRRLVFHLNLHLMLVFLAGCSVMLYHPESRIGGIVWLPVLAAPFVFTLRMRLKAAGWRKLLLLALSVVGLTALSAGPLAWFFLPGSGAGVGWLLGGLAGLVVAERLVYYSIGWWEKARKGV